MSGANGGRLPLCTHRCPIGLSLSLLLPLLPVLPLLPLLPRLVVPSVAFGLFGCRIYEGGGEVAQDCTEVDRRCRAEGVDVGGSTLLKQTPDTGHIDTQWGTGGRRRAGRRRREKAAVRRRAVRRMGEGPTR